MIGVLVVTHGPLGEGLIAAAARLGGSAPAVRSVSVGAGEAAEQIAERIAWEAEQLDGGQGVLFLVDLHGSTPGNLCISESRRRPGSDVLFGVNLAMLLKLETANRETTCKALAEQLEVTAVRSIYRLSQRTESNE